MYRFVCRLWTLEIKFGTINVILIYEYQQYLTYNMGHGGWDMHNTIISIRFCYLISLLRSTYIITYYYIYIIITNTSNISDLDGF